MISVKPREYNNLVTLFIKYFSFQNRSLENRNSCIIYFHKYLSRSINILSAWFRSHCILFIVRWHKLQPDLWLFNKILRSEISCKNLHRPNFMKLQKAVLVSFGNTITLQSIEDNAQQFHALGVSFQVCLKWMLPELVLLPLHHVIPASF